MLTAPKIPDGRIRFGAPAWIAVDDAAGVIREELANDWKLKMRRAVNKDGTKNVPCACLSCDDHVENGEHYTRGWQLWMHRSCYDQLRAFSREVQQRFPDHQSQPQVMDPGPA